MKEHNKMTNIKIKVNGCRRKDKGIKYSSNLWMSRPFINMQDSSTQTYMHDKIKAILLSVFRITLPARFWTDFGVRVHWLAAQCRVNMWYQDLRNPKVLLRQESQRLSAVTIPEGSIMRSTATRGHRSTTTSEYRTTTWLSTNQRACYIPFMG